MNQQDKGYAFHELHQRPGVFIIPNPWDAGSARLLSTLGFQALATTSAGYAFSQGLRDFQVGRDRMLAHVAQIVSATDLPVSADLENGFGDDPVTVAKTISMAAETGLVGASIEDATGNPDKPVYEFGLAVDRVRAACEAARALPFRFVLTARADNFVYGHTDLDDTIRRLQAYQDAGADVLYAPGLHTREDIERVVASVDRPVNVVMGLAGASFSLQELSDIGVRRISVGSALQRAAYGALLRATREMQHDGTFTFAEDAVPYSIMNELFKS